MESYEKRFSVNEIFGPTIQGEGALAGAVTHFVRLNGCDYRCSWCDTLDAVLPELIAKHHQSMTTIEIANVLRDLPPARMVTLSGGNPAIHKDLGDLIQELKSWGFTVAMETQGSVAQTWFSKLNYLILSPKPPSSGMAFNEQALRECIEQAPGNTSFKVVAFSDEDLEFAYEIHKMVPSYLFYLQVGCPQGPERPHDLVELNKYYQALVKRVLGDHRFQNARVLPQLHKQLFGHGRGV